MEVTEVECGQDENEPEDARGGRDLRAGRGRSVEERVVSLRHEMKSLTLKECDGMAEVGHTGANTGNELGQ